MKQRQLVITTPLGSEDLVLNRMVLRERLNAPFEMELDLSALDENLDYDQIVGQPVSISLDLNSNDKRYFHGLVNRMAQTGSQGGFARYRAWVVPWLWFLTRTSDCRVFQRLSTLDIAEQVLGKDRFGSDYYQLRTSATYPKRRYCVQYRETDFNFVNRLLESEGVTYWFEHQQGKHQLILADRIGGSKTRPGYETVDFHQVETAMVEARQVVTAWTVEQEVQTVNYTLKDFDFKKPSDPLKGNYEVTREHGMARFAIYDFPGDYFDPAAGNKYAQVRLEELQARYTLVHATTTSRGLAAGQVFELRNHPRTDQNRKYLITDLTLTAEAGEFASGGSAGEFFQCNFTAIPADTPFRPPRATPKPVVQGLQSATVVGPSGEEIYTDQYGRVKVQFHWDRYGKSDDDSSCWVRVSQNWAGKNWGAMHIPRIGQEVIVEFLEGDPDRPVITGRVYNAEQPVPYSLPGNKTQSGIISRSSQGGGPNNFNEIRMEDKKGSEQLYVQAERNMDMRVKNDSKERVFGNRHLIVGWEKDGVKGGDQREMVYRDKHLTVNRNQIEQIGGNMQLTVGGIDSGQGNQDIDIKGIKKELIEGDNHLHVKGARNEAVDGAQSLTVGGSQQEKIGSNQELEAGKEIHLKAGTTLVLEAGTQLSLKVGGNFIDIGPGGVSISGTMVMINSGGSPASGSASSPTAPQDAAPATPVKPAIATDRDAGQQTPPG